jgi:hypothetical protein
MTLGLGTGSVQSPNFFHAGLSELGPEGPMARIPFAHPKASGHSSVQMHKRYVDLQAADVARSFGTAADSQIDTRIDTQNRRASRN